MNNEMASGEKNTLSVENFVSELTCSVSLEPLYEAVSLIPCSHKLNEKIAEQIFGKTFDGWKIHSQKKCPMCIQVVIGYTVDFTIRNIVAHLSGVSLQMLEESQKIIRNRLPEKTLDLASPVLTPIPFPGIAAKFKHNGGVWDRYFDSGAPLCRRIEFVSLVEKSTIKEFSFLGYKCGTTAMIIYFRKNVGFCDFLRSHGIFVKSIDEIAGSFKSQTKEDLKTLFFILATHSDIPDSYYVQLKEIVEDD
jgi:hypothetical protein